MFGYLKPRLKGLSKENKEEYRSIYCGLCHILKKNYGHVGVFSLNYEFTAFIILILSLQETEYRIFHGACSITPFMRVPYIDYFKDEMICGSALSVFFVNNIIEDNINDEKKFRWKVAKQLYKSIVKKSIDEVGNETSYINHILNQFYMAERMENTSFEKLVQLSGEIIRATFQPLLMNVDGSDRNTVLEIGRLVGEWIYLIDACDDYYEDLRLDRFNPLKKVEDRCSIKDKLNSISNSIENNLSELNIVNYNFLVNYIFVDTIRLKNSEIYSKYERGI